MNIGILYCDWFVNITLVALTATPGRLDTLVVAGIHECFLALERALIWWRSGESIERRVEDRFARNRLTGPHLQPTIVSL